MNQKNMPLVTAVIPVYNHEKYVVESIRSILNQTYQNIELIVINDGSKDRSHQMILPLVEECRQRFVRFEYINRENIGLIRHAEPGAGVGQGRLFIRRSPPTMSHCRKRSKCLSTRWKPKAQPTPPPLATPGSSTTQEIEFASTKMAQLRITAMREACDNFLDFYTRSRGLDYRGEEFGSYASLISGNYLPAMSNVVRTTAILDAGGWTPGNIIEDWEMWLKLSKKFKFLCTSNQPAALYRWHAFEHRCKCSRESAFRIRSFQLLLRGKKQFCFDNGLGLPWQSFHYSMTDDLLEKRSSFYKRQTRRF